MHVHVLYYCICQSKRKSYSSEISNTQCCFITIRKTNQVHNMHNTINTMYVHISVTHFFYLLLFLNWICKFVKNDPRCKKTNPSLIGTTTPHYSTHGHKRLIISFVVCVLFTGVGNTGVYHKSLVYNTRWIKQLGKRCVTATVQHQRLTVCTQSHVHTQNRKYKRPCQWWSCSQTCIMRFCF